MSRFIGCWVIVLVACWPERGSAQVVVGGGFRVGFTTQRISVSIFAGSARPFGFGCYAPPLFAPPPLLLAPVPPIAFAPPPLFAPVPIFVPAPVFVPEPIFAAPIIARRDPAPAPAVARREPAAPVAVDPLDRFPADQFLVIRPRAPREEAPEPLVNAAPERVGLPREPKLVLQPLPEADPKAESRRQILMGMEAFAAQQYGRAVERFQQAIIVTPRDHKPHALLAEAYFALGKYREAMVEIEATLALDPDWPIRRFDPAELDGPDPAVYRARLQALTALMEQRPDDPMLLFLSAYHEWFGGDRQLAIERFQRARERTTDTKLIDRFLLSGGKPV